MTKTDFSKQAKKDIEKLIKLRNEKFLEKRENVWLQELSDNNGPWAKIEDGIPEVEIFWYFTGRGDGKIVLTDENYDKNYVPIKHHTGISIKKAIELEIEKMKKTPMELEHYDGIEEVGSHLSGGGYVLEVTFKISKGTPLETIRSFLFHKAPSKFSVKIGENASSKTENDENFLETVKKNHKKTDIFLDCTFY